MSIAWCPYCKAKHTAATKDSRLYNEVRRRRKTCSNCDQKFTTVEVSYPGEARGLQFNRFVNLAVNLDASLLKMETALDMIHDVLKSP